MSNSFKDIHIKNRTYYFFNDMTNMKTLDPNKIKINKKSYKNIVIYYIGYLMVKDLRYVKINTVNPLCLIINKTNGYFEKSVEINIRR